MPHHDSTDLPRELSPGKQIDDGRATCSSIEVHEGIVFPVQSDLQCSAPVPAPPDLGPWSELKGTALLDPDLHIAKPGLATVRAARDPPSDRPLSDGIQVAK